MGKRTKVPPGKQRVRLGEGIYLKQSGKYLATFRDPGGHQHWQEFRTKAEAQAWRHRGKVDPRSVVGGRRRLFEVWTQFLDHHAGQMRPNTLANWRQEWRKYLEPALGSWPVGKVTVVVVKDFLSTLEKEGVGPATRSKCRSILHRLYEECIENGEVSSNPVTQGTRVRMPQRKRARILTPSEVRSVAVAAGRVGKPSDGLAVEVMCFLGLRVGEMAGLQARDIDTKRGEIVIQRTVSDANGRLIVQAATKTNKLRRLPIPPELPIWASLLDHLRTEGLIGEAHVFRAAGGGVIRPNNWRRRVWDWAMAEAGIEDPPTPHSGRRTAASLLSGAGVPPAVIQGILGHSTLQQTGEYVDVPRSQMEDGFRRLADIYATAGATSS